jgi:hypothetical protein
MITIGEASAGTAAVTSVSVDATLIAFINDLGLVAAERYTLLAALRDACERNDCDAVVQVARRVVGLDVDETR